MKKEDRPEYCQRRQDDFREFERAYYGRMGVKQYRPRYYPTERYAAPIASCSGWRIAMYADNGFVGRAFPYNVRLHANGTRRHDPDLQTFPLRREWEVMCDHECWPRPHPDCECGVWASETTSVAAAFVRQALIEDGWRAHRRDADSRLIAHPVDLRDVVRRTNTVNGVRTVELVASRARIAGPLLTANAAIAADLLARGFDAEHVADSHEELAAHLESMAVTT